MKNPRHDLRTERRPYNVIHSRQDKTLWLMYMQPGLRVLEMEGLRGDELDTEEPMYWAMVGVTAGRIDVPHGWHSYVRSLDNPRLDGLAVCGLTERMGDPDIDHLLRMAQMAMAML